MKLNTSFRSSGVQTMTFFKPSALIFNVFTLHSGEVMFTLPPGVVRPNFSCLSKFHSYSIQLYSFVCTCHFLLSYLYHQ